MLMENVEKWISEHLHIYFNIIIFEKVNIVSADDPVQSTRSSADTMLISTSISIGQELENLTIWYLINTICPKHKCVQIWHIIFLDMI